MNRFYLPNEYLYYFAGFILFLVFIGFYLIALFLLLVGVSVFFLFRKSKRIKADGNLKNHGLIKAPCFGKVKSIRSGIRHKEFGENLTEILIIIPHIREYGLYFPCASEMEFQNKGIIKDFFRYRRKYNLDQSNGLIGGHVYNLKSATSNNVGLQLVKCHLGFEPILWTLPGDRGASGARVGWFPLGGSVLLFLSKDYEVVAKIGDKLIGGETLIAKEKVENK